MIEFDENPLQVSDTDRCRDITGNLQAMAQTTKKLQESLKVSAAKETMKVREQRRKNRDWLMSLDKSIKIELMKLGDGVKIQREKLHKAFKEQHDKAVAVLTELQGRERTDITRRESEHKRRSLSIESASGGHGSGLEMRGGGGGGGSSGKQAQAQEQEQEFQFNAVDMEIIDEKHRDMQELEGQLVELHQIWQDITPMLDKQQEGIDEMDKNVSTAHAKTKQGLTHMQDAREYQRQARKKACCFTMFVLIILAVILVTTVPMSNTSSGYSNTGNNNNNNNNNRLLWPDSLQGGGR